MDHLLRCAWAWSCRAVHLATAQRPDHPELFPSQFHSQTLATAAEQITRTRPQSCRRRRFHRTPPIVGFLRIMIIGDASRFTPNNPAAGRDLPGWLVVDCRHGRAAPSSSRQAQAPAPPG
ncbi:hypothetical protein E2562_014704 [Oryza meyeriana var. granulata]|uniref:Uncharacterized protein n=1 Tax=Oryza meyeriana var. granulata TaxID=110450 RepID=A0A6G1D4Q2_9ORYZ|nr:hypothetical protein E2562_014704 [Oryza meyeriana var. granulata]